MFCWGVFVVNFACFVAMWIDLDESRPAVLLGPEPLIQTAAAAFCFSAASAAAAAAAVAEKAAKDDESGHDDGSDRGRDGSSRKRGRGSGS